MTQDWYRPVAGRKANEKEEEEKKKRTRINIDHYHVLNIDNNPHMPLQHSGMRHGIQIPYDSNEV